MLIKFFFIISEKEFLDYRLGSVGILKHPTNIGDKFDGRANLFIYFPFNEISCIIDIWLFSEFRMTFYNNFLIILNILRTCCCFTLENWVKLSQKNVTGNVQMLNKTLVSSSTCHNCFNGTVTGN